MMTKNKKILISIFVGLIIIFSSIFLKLTFSSISMPYLKAKISTLMLDLNGTVVDVDQVELRLIKDIGFAIEIPNIKISHHLYYTFNSKPDNLGLMMECKFSKVFEKWIPIRFVNNDIFNKTIIETIENNLKDNE